MSFLKYAKATLQKPDILFAEWDALRQKAVSPAPDFQQRTAKIILQEYDPSRYMLSHATIVASVDVENSPAPLGKHYIDGFEINRKYPDYYITPNTVSLINNNFDAFERKLLLATYKTFVGAFSFVEHVQIPELAKGRIIDAAARDVGDSVYIDILIANELKHAPLIRAIKSGQLGTLSMGCFVPGSQVTMADGRRLPIEEVAVGDFVITHKGRPREVTNKQIHIGHFNVKCLGIASSKIIATNNHPFFVVRDSCLEETRVDKLLENDLLYFPETDQITSISFIQDLQYEGPVHNMEVEEDHSYIVEGVAVHNCSTTTTTCSKCGNVANDETQLCNCVKYFKGSEFVNELNHKTKVAELCGSYRDSNSVKFIEASWVANPAFKGAVLRNILSADELKEVENKMHMAFNLPPTTSIPNAMDKAAYCKYSEGESFCNCKTGEDYNIDTTPTKEEPAKDDAIQKAISDLVQTIRDQAIEKVRKEIDQNEADKVKSIVDPNKQNESLVRSAMQRPEWRKVAKVVNSFVRKAQGKRVLQGLILYKQGKWPMLKAAGFTNREILAVSRVIDLMTKRSFIAGENRLYRAVLSVGGMAPYENEETYLAACRQALGRNITGSEAAELLRKGRLF